MWDGLLCWINYHPAIFFLVSVHLYIYTHIYIMTFSLPLYPYLSGKRIESFFLIFSVKTSSTYVSDKCGSRFCHLVMMWLLDVWKLFNFQHKYKLFFICIGISGNLQHQLLKRSKMPHRQKAPCSPFTWKLWVSGNMAASVWGWNSPVTQVIGRLCTLLVVKELVLWGAETTDWERLSKEWLWYPVTAEQESWVLEKHQKSQR